MKNQNELAKQRGIRRAQYTVVGSDLDEIAIEGEVDVKIEIDNDPEHHPTHFTDPTWFTLLKFFDDYLVKNDIVDHVYFEGIYLEADIFCVSCGS